MKILIAEDEKILANVYCSTLRQMGYDVSVCYDGEEVLRLLTSEDWDLRPGWGFRGR